MTQYIYFVKCPHCDDEPFDFFDDAKAFAAECIASKPIITQIEVERNDFGECTNSTDLGTVWSWEELAGASPDAEPEVTFSKADFDSDIDAEFDSLDNSVDVPDSTAISTMSTDNIIPEATPTIEQLVEMMEENEDVVECKWCNELFDKSECRFEVDLGWLCDRCQAAIASRGEPLTFHEGPLTEATMDNDTIELEYDDLTATVATGYVPATREDPSYYEEGEYTGHYLYEVNTENLVEVLFSEIMSAEDVEACGGKVVLEDEEAYAAFLDKYIDAMLDKYMDKILEHYRENAAEEASNSEKFQAEYDDHMEALEDAYWDSRYEEERDRRRFGDDY